VKLIYPDDIELEMYRKGGRKELFHVRYREAYRNRKNIKQVIEHTVRLYDPTAHQLDLKVTSGDNWIELIGTLNREQIANFVVGEFMPVSSLGELRMKRIFELAVTGALLTTPTAQPTMIASVASKAPRKRSKK